MNLPATTVSEPAAIPVPIDRLRAPTAITQQLHYLATLSGLTCFEQAFVARLSAYPNPDAIPARELTVLEQIWQRHGRRTA